MNEAMTGIENNDNGVDGRKQGRNLLRFHGEAAASSVEDAAVAYQAPSIIAAGANAQTVSILATLVNMCLALISFKAPSIIQKLGVTKRGSIALSLSNVLTWALLVIVFFLARYGITPAWVAALWLINIMPGMLLSFQKDNWLSSIVPGHAMGKYLGKRLAIKSGFYLAAFFLFGYLMDALGDSSLMSFGLVFFVATAMTLLYTFVYTKMYDPKEKELGQSRVETPKVDFKLKDYLLDLKVKKLDKFVIFTGLINVSIGLSAPFYAVYMLQEQNFTYMSYTIIISVEFLARIISCRFWGKFADKKGNIEVLKIVSRIVPVLPICWLFSSNVAYLACIQVISGICWGAFDLSTQSYLYKVAPPKTKLHYIVYTRSLMLLFVAVGGLAGSFLIRDIFEIFGSKILTVLMISGLLRAAIVVFLMPKLIDLAIKYWAPQKTRVNLVLTKKETTKNGLFYHTSELGEIQKQNNVIEVTMSHKRNPAMEQRLMETYAAKKQLELLTETVQTGARRNWALAAIAKTQGIKTPSFTASGFSKTNDPGIELREKSVVMKNVENEQVITNTTRRNWTIREKPSKVAPEPDPTEKVTPCRRPWFGDEEIFENYQTVRLPAIALTRNLETTLIIGKTNTPSRNGLFHDDESWTRYKEQSLQAVINENKAYQTKDRKRNFTPGSSYYWR